VRSGYFHSLAYNPVNNLDLRRIQKVPESNRV
jgi:hypothetical protein